MTILEMVVEEKALVGKLSQFPIGIRRFFSLSCYFQSAKKTSNLFHPFGCINSEQQSLENDQNQCVVIDTSDKKVRAPFRSLSQTYPQWKVMCDFHKLHSLKKRKRFKNRTLYILPMGTEDAKPTVNNLEMNCQNDTKIEYRNLTDVILKFASLFFYGMNVKLLPYQDIDSLGFCTRIHKCTDQRQVLVTDILCYLKKIRPDDSFCIIGWSLLDLYPSKDLNFVLGEACFDSGCAVISFGRYSDFTSSTLSSSVGKDINTKNMSTDVKLREAARSPDTSLARDNETCSKNLVCHKCHWNCQNYGNKVVWRVLKVLTHEVCHVIGMHHCTFFACLMNESNNVSQAESQPLFLCPVCLRKLHKFLQFPILPRYQILKDFMEDYCAAVGDLQKFYLNQDDWSDGNNFMCDISKSEPTFASTCDYDAFAVKKFRDCSTWLEQVLEFIVQN